jgi:hypothetical protein
MIIDYGKGGLYPGVEIIEFPQIYGWFGISAPDVFIAKITARVSTPEIDFSVSTPRIDAFVQVISGSGTMIP